MESDVPLDASRVDSRIDDSTPPPFKQGSV